MFIIEDPSLLLIVAVLGISFGLMKLYLGSGETLVLIPAVLFA